MGAGRGISEPFYLWGSCQKRCSPRVVLKPLQVTPPEELSSSPGRGRCWLPLAEVNPPVGLEVPVGAHDQAAGEQVAMSAFPRAFRQPPTPGRALLEVGELKHQALHRGGGVFHVGGVRGWGPHR